MILDFLFRNATTGGQRILTSEQLAEYLTGRSSSSAGVDVTPDRALKYAAVYACVRVLAESVGQLPLHLYQQREREKTKATDHPLYALLYAAPNGNHTAQEWKEWVVAGLALRGNSFSQILRTGSRITGLDPLPNTAVTPKQDATGAVFYEIRLSDGTQEELPAREVLHIKLMPLHGILGASPIQYARESIGLAIAAEEHGAGLFARGAAPGGVLVAPGTLSKDAQERLKESWAARHEGSGNSHRVAVLEGGLKWESIGMPSTDAQWLESRKYQRSEVAGIYRVPPHLIGDLERSTFCLPADVEVLTQHGPKSIAAVRAGERVWSLGKAGMVLAPVKRSVCSGEDELLEIRTTNRMLRCNAAHRVLARRKRPAPRTGPGGYQGITWSNEYVPAGELQVGDTVVTLDELPAQEGALLSAPNGRKLTVGFMEFCGHLLGNGNIKPGWGVEIARAKNARYMDAYRAIAQREFVSFVGGNGRGIRKRPTAPVRLCESERSTKFASVLAAAELTELGLGGVARTKRVPDWVFGTSAELQLAFLRGFIDADGHVDKKGRASLSSVNQQMLSQLRHLCMMLGIPVTNIRCSRVTVRLPNGKPFDSESYTFTCSDPGANARIGSHDPVDVERFAAGKPFARKDRNYPRHGGADFDAPGCSLARIASIRHLPAEPVYDLEVEGTHSFIANGVVVHNSNIEHQGLDFVVHTLMPYLTRIEQRISLQLLSPEERKSFFPKFNVAGLLRGDMAARSQFYTQMVQNGALSPNEIRELEDRNPREGGDVYLTPANMLVNGKAPETKPPGQ